MIRKKLFILYLCSTLCFLFACSPNTKSDTEKPIGNSKNASKNKVQKKIKKDTPIPKVTNTPEPSIAPTPTALIKYDALQQLYLDLNPKMSYKKMIKLVKSTKLPYSEEKYNGGRTVQVAFTKGSTAQKYKKESGDYLEIIYLYPRDENSTNDIINKYTFGTCVYTPNDSSLQLITHVSGNYFSYYEPGNYISDLGNTLDLNKDMSKKEQLKYYFENK